MQWAGHWRGFEEHLTYKAMQLCAEAGVEAVGLDGREAAGRALHVGGGARSQCSDAVCGGWGDESGARGGGLSGQ